MRHHQCFHAISGALKCSLLSNTLLPSKKVPVYSLTGIAAVILGLFALLIATIQPSNAQSGKTSAPSKGATLSGNWSEWNLLANRPSNNYGNISTRVRTAFYNYMGLNGDIPAVDVRFVPGKSDEAFSSAGNATVDSTGTQYWESITEGQGYAMMFAAEFGDGSGSADDIAAHKMFDALARYDNRELQSWHGEPPYYWYSDSYTYVRQSDGYVYHPAVGNFNGVSNVVRVAPAPDGEQWIAQAYFIAAGKWGSKGADGNPINLIAFQAIPGVTYPAKGNNTVTTTDYAGMGNLKLQSYIHTEDWYGRDNYPGAQYALVNMFDINHNQSWNPSNNTYLPAFINDNGYSGSLKDYQITDDSYCLPAFAEYWSKYATADNAVWAKVASAERALIHANVNNSPTGLASCYCSLSGTAYARPSDGQQGLENDGDASRVPATNITLDWMWWGDPTNSTEFGWQNSWANTFIGGEWNRSTKVYGPQPSTKSDYYGLSYSGALFQDGTEVNGITSHLEGTAAQNAACINLVNNQGQAWYFVDELMNMPQPDGVATWGSAYWDGSLYMIGLMEAAAYFRPTPPTGGGGGGGTTKPAAPTLTATPGNASVALSWNAPTGATSYQVKYGTSSGSYSTTLASQSGTSANISSLTNGTKYYFVVTASNSAGTSGYSNEASATPSSGSTGGSPTITITASSISPSTSVSAGATITYSVTFKNTGGALSNGQLGIRVNNGGGTQVDQYTLTGVNLAAGASQTITYSSKASTTTGAYAVYAAAWNSTYSTTYVYSQVQTLTVGSASAPSISITSSSISPSTSDTAGSSITYSVTFKNSGGALSNGQLGIRVNNSGGTQVDQYTLTGVSLAGGATKTITYASKTPTTKGAYTVYGAAWNSSYSTTYVYSSIQTLTSK